MFRVLLAAVLLTAAVFAEPIDVTPPPAVPPKPFFTGKNAHKYLGYATLVASAVSAMAPKEEGGVHEYAGWTAGGLALATVATGIAYHRDDIYPAHTYKDPDNLHALLGGAGALSMALGLSRAPKESHAGGAMAGAGLMMLSIYFVW